MCDAKEYVALQQECERLRAENQRLNKCLARYRAKYGELSEPDKGGEIGGAVCRGVKSRTATVERCVKPKSVGRENQTFPLLIPRKGR